MRYVKLKSLPKIQFAHTFASEKYINDLPVYSGRIEVCYVAEGVNHVSQGGGDYTETKGDVSCNLFEAITHVQTETFHEHHSISFWVEYEQSNEDSEGALLLPRHVKFSERKRIHDLVDEIISVYTLHPTQTTRLSGLFLQLLAEIDETVRKRIEGENGSASLYVKKAKAFVYANLQKSMTQRQVAEYVGVTPEYLCFAFKKAGEESLITFINKEKLTKLKTVMYRENLKLYQAAELFGYNDPNYVSRLYKKYFGQNITDKS